MKNDWFDIVIPMISYWIGVSIIIINGFTNKTANCWSFVGACFVVAGMLGLCCIGPLRLMRRTVVEGK